jgi:hypothetical protein
MDDLDLIETLIQDLKTSLEVFISENYELVNILANRFMANCLFGDNYKIFLPGFYLKEINQFYSEFKQSKEARAFGSSKSLGEQFIKFLINNFGKDLNEEKFWEEYYNFSSSIYSYNKSEIENKTYKENKSFTKRVTSFLREFLMKNQNILMDLKNNVLGGVLNELSRVFRTYNFDLEDLLFYSIISALIRYYDYVLFRNYDRSNDKLDVESVKTEILPILDSIKKLFESKVNIQEFDVLLWTIIKSWRENFILYTEIAYPKIMKKQIEKTITLPQETKDLIQESILEKLEKKVSR